MIKMLPLDFLGVSHRIPWKNKNTNYRLQISALVPEIFVFKKYVKYAKRWLMMSYTQTNIIRYIKAAERSFRARF